MLAKLRSWRSPKQFGQVVIDDTPTAKEEEDHLFTREKVRAQQLANESDRQDIDERIRYANHAYGITQAWIGFLMVLTIAQITLKPLGLGLESAVFITVFTTTTAAVFGFWLLVGQYLFHRKS